MGHVCAAMHRAVPCESAKLLVSERCYVVAQAFQHQPSASCSASYRWQRSIVQALKLSASDLLSVMGLTRQALLPDRPYFALSPRPCVATLLVGRGLSPQIVQCNKQARPGRCRMQARNRNAQAAAAATDTASPGARQSTKELVDELLRRIQNSGQRQA